MNKKLTVILLCIILLATLSLAVACEVVPDDPTPTPTPPTPQPTVYDKLNELVKAKRDKLNLTVETAVGEDRLVSTFKVAETDGKTTIEYQIQTLAEIDLDNGTTSRINTQKGSCVVEDGKIVQQDGQNCDVELEKITATIGLRFDEKYFSDVTVTENVFKAKVVDFKSFSGTDIVAKSAETEIAYAEQAISSIKITYATATATITATYLFD